MAVLLLSACSGFSGSAARGQEATAEGRRTDFHGDPLPAGAIARCGTVRWRHVGAFLVAYGRDGKTLLSVSQTEVRFWDLASGRIVRQINTGTGRNDVAAISNDGKLLAVVKDFGRIKVFEIESGEESHSFRPAEGSVVAIAFSPDRKCLAARRHGESVPLVWRLTTKEKLNPFEEPNGDDLDDFFGGHLFESHSVAFSPDGKHLATASEQGAVALWQVGTGKLVCQVKTKSGGPPMVTFSPDGKLFACEKADGVTILADAATGKEVRTVRTPDCSAQSLTFSPDSKQLVAVLNSDVVSDVAQFWDVATGRATHKLKGDLWAIKSVAFSPDGKMLAAAGEGQIRQWSTATGEERRFPDSGVGPIFALALSPDGKSVATGSSEGAVRLWQASTGKPKGTRFDQSPSATLLEFSPDCKSLAICRDAWQELSLCDVATGKQRLLAVDDESSIFALAFVPDGQKLVHCYDRMVRIFSTATGKEERHFGVPLVGTTTPDICLAPNGGVLAAYKCDEAQGREVFGERLYPIYKLTNGIVSNGALSADGRMLALVVSPVERVVKERAYPDRTKPPDIVICELMTGQERLRFKAHGLDVHHLCLSPRGKLLAFGEDDSIRVYEVRSGEQLCQFQGHQGSITGIVFSQDESKIVSASIDTTALVWDISRLRDAKPRPVQSLDRDKLQVLWSDLASQNASKAYQAIQRLAAGPESTAFLERELLAFGRSFPARKKRVERLIPMLDSEQFEQRERATRELKELREDAELVLRGVLTGEQSAEVRRRVTLVLNGMQGEPPSPEILRLLRAVEALEQSGTAEARGALQALANGPAEARLTREAGAALDRLEKRRGQ
jgi:WD40 repeat protein